MRLTFVLAALLAVAVAVGGVAVYYLWTLPRFTMPREVPVRVENDRRPNPDDCRLACDRLTICHDARAGEECAVTCREQWNRRSVRCVQQAACDQVDACFRIDEEREQRCADACEKAESCGLPEAGPDCPTACREQWDVDFRECLLESTCDDIPLYCLPAMEDEECNRYCRRLRECDLEGPGDEVGCVETCLAVDDPLLRDCVERVDCESIEPICLADDYDPLCLDVCDRLDRCDALGDIDPIDCPALCHSEWDELQISCLLTESCDDLGPVCLEQVDPECEQVCLRLIDCGLEDVYEDCVLTCGANLEDELRACILDTECENIDRVCFAAGEDLCDLACRKAVECNLDEDYTACYDACQEGYDTELIGCILAFDCAQIGEQCLGTPPPLAP
ncbi:MAG TPA: hypothetical protein PKW95_01025 [bacterium]|nr:hypothetical protein [bacterium]